MATLTQVGSTASIYLSFAGTNQYLCGRADLELLSQSAANKTSTISVALYLYKSGSTEITSNTVFRGTVSCGFSSSYTSASLNLGETPQLVYTGSHVYEHASDGTGLVQFSASTRYGSRTESSDSENVTLPTISVSSTLYISPNTAITVGSTPVTISIQTPDSSWTHLVRLRNSSGSTLDIYTFNAGVTSHTFTPGTSVGQLMGSSTVATLYFDCIAYTGSGTQLGTSTVSRSFTISSSTGPTVGSPTITAVNSSGSTVAYGHVAGVSYLKLQWSVAGNYGASVSSAGTTIDGVAYTASISSGVATVITSKPVGTTGTKTITVYATDSRGYTNSASADISVTAYNNPRINTFSVVRSLSDGTVSTSGTYCLVDYAYEVTRLSSYNKYSLLIEYRVRENLTWSTSSTFTLTNQAVPTTQPVTNYGVVNLGDSESVYEFRITVTDTLSGTDGRAVTTRELGTDTVMIDLRYDGQGLAIGKLAELAGVLDIGYAIRLYGGILPMIITSASDLGTYRTPGFYSGTTTNSITGVPSGIGGDFGVLIVPTGGSTVSQILFEKAANSSSVPNPYIRSYSGSVWTSWYKLSMTVVS